MKRKIIVLGTGTAKEDYSMPLGKMHVLIVGSARISNGKLQPGTRYRLIAEALKK